MKTLFKSEPQYTYVHVPKNVVRDNISLTGLKVNLCLKFDFRDALLIWGDINHCNSFDCIIECSNYEHACINSVSYIIHVNQINNYTVNYSVKMSPTISH